jgi:hypothetical protein
MSNADTPDPGPATESAPDADRVEREGEDVLDPDAPGTSVLDLQPGEDAVEPNEPG